MTLTYTENTHTTSFADMLEQYESPLPKRGQFLEGEILRITDDVVFVDVGAKRDAIVPYYEIAELDESYLAHLSSGDAVPVYVLRTPRGDEELLVSLDKGLQQQDWQRAALMMADEEVISCEVVGHNKGGMLVQFGRVRGFVPNSHIPALRHIRDDQQRVTFKQKQIGQEVTVKVIEVNRPEERLVFSIKAAQTEARRQRIEALQVGDVINGRVTNLTKYGAFIDLGGVDGLLHISQIAWERPEHPGDILSVGDEVEVLVEAVDVERERITLDRKALLASPYGEFADEHTVSELVEGVVTSVVNFGAFVRVADGVEGLVHISQLSDGPVHDPEAIVQPGDKVLTRIINIDADEERLGLSLQHVTTDEQIEWMME